MRVSLVLLAAAAASLCLLGSAAGGSFPGANGLIGFTCGLSVCQSMVDGTSAGALISDGADPAWSADGTKIAFVKAGDVWTANADGSNQQLVVAAASNPTWSPSGDLAYVKADGHISERFGSTETQ